MTLRSQINDKYGSLYGFAREKKTDLSVLYSVFSGRRAASKRVLDMLVSEFGEDAARRFDNRGLLIAGL
jgi:hypothetical protein